MDSWREAATEDYLEKHPELLDRASDAIDLLYEEILLCEQAGEEGVWEDASKRFPQWSGGSHRWRSAIACSSPRPRPVPERRRCRGRIPDAGGTGSGWARTRLPGLATRLADWRVVLKLTPQLGREHVSLARLQHTNIVPLYSAQEDRGRKLRLLCMPYLGNATLARLLGELSRVPLGQRTGQGLVAALERIQREAPLPPAPGGGAQAIPDSRTYVEAICWIGPAAEAMQYAHERGLVHLDLKPSNVLVAADGQPLLLDFPSGPRAPAAGQTLAR